MAELVEETQATMSAPEMRVGAVEGRFLELLVFALQAKRVLELGTFTGYSSLAMAAGLPEGGHVDSCEVSEEHAEVARRYHAQSPYGDRITIHMGPALETTERPGGERDGNFLDADQESYGNYYDELVKRLRPTGLMTIDHTVCSGRVLDGEDDSPGTRAIRALNDRIAADERVVAVQLTVRDGVTLVRRR